MIEACPVILLPEKDQDDINKTELEHYIYLWGKNFTKSVIVLGYGLLYNHSYSANAIFRRDTKHNIMNYISAKDIPAHTEITVNYNGPTDDKTPYTL